MAEKALLEKLEEKVQNIQTNAEEKLLKADVSSENNIVAFKKSDFPVESTIVPGFAITLTEAKQRIEMLQEFVKEMMIPEIDFGIVPGCKKPSLYKSGAEKLCDIFGLSKHIEIIFRLEDWEKKVFHYEVKAILINKRTGQVEAEGIGSCNNKEKKYVSLDAYNIINTILKMAKKRALIDAVLSATRSSGIFTQDIEDNETETKSPPNSKESEKRNLKTEAQEPAKKDQLQEILNIICQKKIPLEKAKNIMAERYKVNESKQLTSSQAKDFISYLKKYRAV